MTSDPADRPSATTAEGVSDPSRAASDRNPWPIGFAIVACLVALAYTFYTKHIWEDFFITFRHSRNLAEGHGLVFTPGERVHGFTSPLGTLLPALCYLVTGRTSYVPALWLFRVFSIAAYAGAGVVLLRTLRSDGPARRPEGIFLGLLYLLLVTLLDYSINGMETGFMAFFVAWGLSLALTGLPERWGWTGVCWGALMWTRPDSFVYIIALAAATLTFPRAPRKELLASMLKAAAVCTIIYLPWFAWAWAYYGSPVPHTVIAKSNFEAGPVVQIKIILKETIDKYFTVAAICFQPIYFWKNIEWHPGMVFVSHLLATFSSLYWLMPTRDRLGRMASLCYAILCLYLAVVPNIFSWYFPPVAMLGLVAVVRGTWTLADELNHRSPRSRQVAYLLLGVLCVERAVLFGLTTYQMKVQQEEIETKTRTQIGLWLKDHVRPGERVFLEPLGYIGYFSQARMADWPGLVSPEVVRLRKEHKVDYRTIVPLLKPEWMVLRPSEVAAMSQSRYFLDNYAVATRFDARERLARYGRLPGQSYLNTDSVFTIYNRITPAEDGPARTTRTAEPGSKL